MCLIFLLLNIGRYFGITISDILTVFRCIIDNFYTILSVRPEARAAAKKEAAEKAAEKAAPEKEG